MGFQFLAYVFYSQTVIIVWGCGNFCANGHREIFRNVLFVCNVNCEWDCGPKLLHTNSLSIPSSSRDDNIVKLFEIFHHFRNTLWIRLNSWSCMKFCKKYFKGISFKLDFHSFILHLSIRNRPKKDTKNVFFCDVVKECLAPKINKLYQKKPVHFCHGPWLLSKYVPFSNQCLYCALPIQ